MRRTKRAAKTARYQKRALDVKRDWEKGADRDSSQGAERLVRCGRLEQEWRRKWLAV